MTTVLKFCLQPSLPLSALELPPTSLGWLKSSEIGLFNLYLLPHFLSSLPVVPEKVFSPPLCGSLSLLLYPWSLHLPHSPKGSWHFSCLFLTLSTRFPSHKLAWKNENHRLITLFQLLSSPYLGYKNPRKISSWSLPPNSTIYSLFTSLYFDSFDMDQLNMKSPAAN